MRRLGTRMLAELAEQLFARDRKMVETVERLRLVSGRQLERLFFADVPVAASRARMARRALAGLVEAGVLGRLERRIGGVRAGAAGHVYYLTARGQRLLAYWQGDGLVRGRNPYEPSALFVRHTLAVAEVYVALVEADRAGRLELLSFDSEPACWRPFPGIGGGRQVLKPDALARVADGDYETRAWLEVDCGTEGRAALLRKCRTYLAYHHSGGETERFPKVIWITTTHQRAGLLAEVCGSLPADAWHLFAVTTPERLIDLLVGEVSS